MAYTDKVWKDSPDHTTPLSAAALNDWEARIKAETDALSVLADAKVAKSGDSTGAVRLIPTTAGDVPLTLKLAASQTADPFRITDSADAKQVWVEADGKVRIGTATGTLAATDNPTSQSEAMLRASRTTDGTIFHFDVNGGYIHANQLGFGTVGNGTANPPYMKVESGTDLAYNLGLSISTSGGYGTVGITSLTGAVPFLILSSPGDLWARPGTALDNTNQSGSQRFRVLADFTTIGSWDGATEYARFTSDGFGVGITPTVPIHGYTSGSGTVFQLDTNGHAGRWAVTDAWFSGVGSGSAAGPVFQSITSGAEVITKMLSGSTASNYGKFVVTTISTNHPLTIFEGDDNIWLRPGTSSAAADRTGSVKVYATGGIEVSTWAATGTVFKAVPGASPTIGFYGATPVTKPTVSGSRGANAALASLITALASQGLLTDSSS